MKFIIHDNNEFRILPIWDGNGFNLNIEARYAYIDNKLYYDLDGKITNKLWIYKKTFDNSLSTSKVKSIGTRYFYSVILNGEIGYIEVGKTLNDIITNEYENNINFYSSRKLRISKQDIKSAFDIYPDYKNSSFYDCSSLPIDLDFIKKNQFNFFEYLNKTSILVKRDEMDTKIVDLINNFIGEIRDEKIDKILN